MEEERNAHETWMCNVYKQILKVYILGIRCGHLKG